MAWQREASLENLSAEMGELQAGGAASKGGHLVEEFFMLEPIHVLQDNILS